MPSEPLSADEIYRTSPYEHVVTAAATSYVVVYGALFKPKSGGTDAK